MFPEPLKRHSTTFATLAMAVAFTLGALAAGCSDDEPAPAAASASTEAVVKSTKNRVKFKGGERIVADLAQALDLPKEDVCKELGTYDCQGVVHTISLGGVEPYRQTIYQPLKDRSMGSVNAVDRVMLSGCEVRASRDFGSPAAATLFKEITAGATHEAVAAVGRRLYQRILRRDPSAGELEGLRAFYDDLASTEGADAPRRFATLACFAVSTTEEALFY